MESESKEPRTIDVGKNRKCIQLSADQLMEQTIRVSMIGNASTPGEEERLRAEFAEWVKQGNPLTEGIEDRFREMNEAWRTELWAKIVALLEKGAALDAAAIPECRRNQTLDALDIAVRVKNVLRCEHNVETIWDLVHIPSQEFMKRRILRTDSRKWGLLIIDAIEQALKLLVCEHGA